MNWHKLFILLHK